MTGGPIDSPAVQELSETIRFVIPSEDRDFHRPKEHWWAQDIGMAEDESRKEFIKQVQQALKNNPIGPNYRGPIDGKETRHLKDIAIKFGWDLEKLTGEKVIITPGDKISKPAFNKAWGILQEHLEGKKQKKDAPKIKKTELVKSFENFFSKDQPIIGKLYTKTGDKEKDLNSLIEAARKTESIIAELIDNNKVGGMIWNSSKKSFNTTPDDVKSALQLISKNKKVSSDRFRSLSYIFKLSQLTGRSDIIKYLPEEGGGYEIRGKRITDEQVSQPGSWQELMDAGVPKDIIMDAFKDQNWARDPRFFELWLDNNARRPWGKTPPKPISPMLYRSQEYYGDESGEEEEQDEFEDFFAYELLDNIYRKKNGLFPLIPVGDYMISVQAGPEWNSDLTEELNKLTDYNLVEVAIFTKDGDMLTIYSAYGFNDKDPDVKRLENMPHVEKFKYDYQVAPGVSIRELADMINYIHGLSSEEAFDADYIEQKLIDEFVDKIRYAYDQARLGYGQGGSSDLFKVPGFPKGNIEFRLIERSTASLRWFDVFIVADRISQTSVHSKPIVSNLSGDKAFEAANFPELAKKVYEKLGVFESRAKRLFYIFKKIAQYKRYPGIHQIDDNTWSIGGTIVNQSQLDEAGRTRNWEELKALGIDENILGTAAREGFSPYTFDSWLKQNQTPLPQEDKEDFIELFLSRVKKEDKESSAKELGRKMKEAFNDTLDEIIGEFNKTGVPRKQESYWFSMPPSDDYPHNSMSLTLIPDRNEFFGVFEIAERTPNDYKVVEKGGFLYMRFGDLEDLRDLKLDWEDLAGRFYELDELEHYIEHN